MCMIVHCTMYIVPYMSTNLFGNTALGINSVSGRVAVPHHFNTDPDPDPVFYFYAVMDPDPDPILSDGNLRQLVYGPSRAPL